MSTAVSRIIRSLGFRITLPLILLWLLLGGLLYRAVDRTLSDYLATDINDEMTWLARGAVEICSRNLDSLIRSGQSGDDRALRVQKVRTLLQLEDYLRDIKVYGLVHDAEGAFLLSEKLPDDLQQSLPAFVDARQLVEFTDNDSIYHLYRTSFEPWGWSISLVRHPASYAQFKGEMLQVYLFAGAVLGVTLLLVLLLISQTINRPVRTMIRQLSQGDSPDYQGVYEIEYLSDAIADSLTRLNQEIDDRHAAQQHLAQLQELLHEIIDAMPSLLIGLDAEGRVLFWNRQAEQLTGVSAAAATGRELAESFPLLQDKVPLITAAISNRQLLSNQRFSSAQNGNPAYYDLTVYPLQSAGRPGAVVRIDDISERMRMEVAMVQSEKMMSVGGLAAGMAHEIKNPLGGILQSAQVLQLRLLGSLPANNDAAARHGLPLAAMQAYLEDRQIPKMLEAIRDSGQRATQIIDNMLSFGRKSESTYGRHDLRELLDRALEIANSDYDMAKKHDFRNIRIQRNYPDRPAWLNCEASAIQQVVLNILKNAAEAMSDASTPEPAFTLTIFESGPMHQVEIRDNGPGMDEATRRRIFEPFFTTKEVGRGTGLGLSVSYFIICENHQGELRVESSPGQGAAFIIRVPRLKDQLVAAPLSTPAAK